MELVYKSHNLVYLYNKYYVYLIKPLITPFIPISLLKSYHIKNKIANEEAKI